MRDAYNESANNCNADTHSAVNEGRQCVDRNLESCSPSIHQRECDTTDQRKVGDENELTREQTLMPYIHENLRTSPSIPNSPIEEKTRQTDDIECNESALDDGANNSDQNAENEPDMEILQHNLDMWNESLNLAAMVAIVGSVLYTVEQYQYTRNVLKVVRSGLTWPPYSRTQRYFSNIMQSIFPKSELVSIPTKFSSKSPTNGNSRIKSDNKPGPPDLDCDTETLPDNGDDRIRDVNQQVRSFLPSSWAKMDVSTSITFQAMYPSFESQEFTPAPLDNSKIVQERELFARPCDHVFVEYQDNIVCTQPRDKIELTVMNAAPTFAITHCLELTSDSYSFSSSIASTWSLGSQKKAKLEL